MNAYLILWPNEWCKLLEKANEKGPLKVIYGGEHMSVPPLTKVTIGDKIYPIRILNGCMYILGCMQVDSIVDANNYLMQQDITTINEELWDTASSKLLKLRPKLGHQIPRNCVEDAALGIKGTKIRFDFSFPSEFLDCLKLGPSVGEEKGLKLKNGKVSHVNLQGHFRRLSENSAQLIENLMINF